ncbi:hypothetical protein D3C79_1087000 [compost metagenome]
MLAQVCEKTDALRAAAGIMNVHIFGAGLLVGLSFAHQAATPRIAMRWRTHS